MHTVGTADRRVVSQWLEDAPALHSRVEAILATCQRLLTDTAPQWMGHCKALIEAHGGACYASLTGADQPLSWRGELPPRVQEFTFTLYCAVWGISNETARAVVDQALAEHLPDAHELPLPPPEHVVEMELL